MKNNYFIGREGFIWFVGVVEDRNDPEQLGRVRVRAFGWHTDNKQDIPTESLPFAQVMHNANGSNTAHAPREGEWVIGFYLDGESAQHPVILGLLPGIPPKKPDTNVGFNDPTGKHPSRIQESSLNRLSRGREDDTVIQTKRRQIKKSVKQIAGTWNEIDTPFAPVYPFNHALESESGHVLELDDTEGNERVHLAHTNGSYIEMHPDGTVAYRANKDRYNVVIGDDYVSIDGDCNITVGGDCNLKVVGKFNVEAEHINMKAFRDFRIHADGKMRIQGDTVDIKGGSVIKIGAGGTLHLKGGTTNVQGGSLNLSSNIKNKVRCPHGMGKILPSGSASSPSSTGL